MNRKTFLLIALLVILLGDSTLCPAVEKTVLGNGLVILTRETRHNEVVAVEVLLRLGTICETDKQAGLSTLTMRLLQKGTTSLDATQIAEKLESVGARLASGSEYDYGSVSLLATREDLEQGLEILLDVLKNATFPEDEVEQEKERLIQSIRARRDRFLSAAFDLFQETHYGAHPYHKPRLGYEETIKKFTRDQVAEFYREYFVPSNMIFSAAGNFDRKRLTARIKKEFGSLPAGRIPCREIAPVTSSRESQESLNEREAEDVWLMMGYAAPAITDPDYPAMEVLNAITGGSMNSRFFVELRDKKGLAYQVGSMYLPREKGGIYTAYLGTRPEQINQCRQGILREVEKLQDREVAEDELKRSKTYLKGTFVMSQETNSGQARLLGRFEQAGLCFDYVERYPELIEQVTAEEIRALANKYLRNYTLGAIVPLDRKEEEDGREEQTR